MVAKSAAILGLLAFVAPTIAEPTLVRRAVPKVARDSCCKSITINPGDTCGAIASANGISLNQLYSLNSNINQGCTNLVAGASICVAGSGDNGSATTTTEAKSSPSTTPAPSSGKCDKTVIIKPGDSCWAIASANGISLDEITALNSWVNSGCTNLMAGAEICVSGNGSQPNKPTKGAKPSKPSSKPDECKKTYTVKAGDTCLAITSANSISLDQFYSWNSGVDSNCSNLIAGNSVCVKK